MEHLPANQIVETAARVIRQHADSTDDDLLARLLESGIHEPAASDFLVLLPLAYGRVSLTELGAVLPEFYLRTDCSGRLSRPLKLDSIPIWTECLACARKDSNPAFAIAKRSPEVKVANSALKDGKELKDLVWSGPILCLSAETAPVTKSSWWTQVWNFPALYSLGSTELIFARATTIAVLLVGLFALGLVAYYAVDLLRAR